MNIYTLAGIATFLYLITCYFSNKDSYDEPAPLILILTVILSISWPLTWLYVVYLSIFDDEK